MKYKNFFIKDITINQKYYLLIIYLLYLTLYNCRLIFFFVLLIYILIFNKEVYEIEWKSLIT